jgi:formylglycine-generating enzyme required for sulfatase activity
MRPAVPPAAPTSLSFGSPVAYNKLNLAWADNANNETGYRIERSLTSGGIYTELSTTAPDAVSYGDTTVSASTTYFYRIRATNNFGNSEYSNEISITTPERSFIISGIVTCGGVPLAGVTISATGLTNSITNEAGNFSLTGGRQNTSYTLTPSRSGYTFTAIPVAVASSDPLPINISATPSTSPLAPTGLTASPVSTTRIALSWVDNANNESGYKIERRTPSEEAYTEIGTVSADATTYNDLSLFASSTRYYRIRATNSVGDSGYSAEVNATTPSVISPVLVKVAGGTFDMGDYLVDGLPNQLPVNPVTVGEFYIGKFEVTQEEWQAIMGPNPSNFIACGTNCPVEKVSWNDVQNFISQLNTQSGKNYRLPTEAEWEYAARSGGLNQRYSGTDDVSVIGSYAWYSGNSSQTTHTVGTKQPNSLGIYDMSGNVFEWVSDLYGPYLTAPTTVFYRGGSWAASGYGFAQTLRTTYRDKASNTYKSDILGFRLASSTP